MNCGDQRKRTPLHVAAEEGEEELIALLLDQKADSNIADLDGNTPLDLAAKGQYESAFNLLLIHSYSSKKDDVVKKMLKKAMVSDRVKDDFVKEKIEEMSPFRCVYVLGCSAVNCNCHLRSCVPPLLASIVSSACSSPRNVVVRRSTRSSSSLPPTHISR